MNGVGGLEATMRETDGLVTPVLNDFYGNVLATITNGTAAWNPIRVGGYGPVNGYQPSALAPGLPLAETLVWRSRRADPTGFYCMGARYYDSLSGRFLSPDPLGHASSMDLYSFASGDPINLFDADGRCIEGIGNTLGLSEGVPYGTDYVSQMHAQAAYNEIGSFIVNTVTLGFGDPISFEVLFHQPVVLQGLNNN